MTSSYPFLARSAVPRTLFQSQRARGIPLQSPSTDQTAGLDGTKIQHHSAGRNLISSVKRDTRRSAAPRTTSCGVSLDSHDHIVVPTQPHSPLRPLVEVFLGSNRPTHALLGPHRPILLEGPCPLDGWFVRPRTLVDFERAFIDGEVALGSPRLVGGEVGVRFEDVVLDQGIPSPAIDGEVAGPGGIVGARVPDGSLAGESAKCSYNSGSVCHCWADLAPPPLHPLPHTKPPLLFQLAEKEPPWPLEHLILLPPSDQFWK